jgi:hypothetical protein
MALMMVSKPGSWLLDVRLSKYELLVSIDDTFASLARELGGVRAEPWDLPPPEGGWSVTDHLAHLAAREALELARVEGRTGAPEILAIRVEAIRRRVLRRGHRGATWSHLEEVHRRLVRAIWDLPESMLRRPWHPARSTTLAAHLAVNTFEHYREHLEKIRSDFPAPRACRVG